MLLPGISSEALGSARTVYQRTTTLEPSDRLLALRVQDHLARAGSLICTLQVSFEPSPACAACHEQCDS
jgi:hypothetical protein